MDGYEVLRRLQADEATRAIPVIFVTALHDDESEQRGFELGAADFIHKPIRAAVALSRIRAQIDARTARDSLRRKAQHMARVAEQGAEQLESTRQQLLQSEKMASLGQLSAGIVHEINNPVGFVASNLAALERYLDDLFSIIDACAADTGAPAEQRLAQVRGLMQRVEYDYVRQDVLDLVAESKDGVERVRQIVADMKGMSHSGASGWQWADLHAGLDSTLNIARNEFRHHCTLVRRYGDLPQIRCIPSQLNQVFMNLVVNAAQAIEGAGEITITTGRVGDDAVRVSVADTGQGISAETLSRLFEPFYTTKPMGKGTGLGLALSREIAQRHRGQIEVSSEPGKGTVFTLTLPIDPVPAEEGDVPAGSSV
jgi:signal transduction histidine kinase